MIGREQRDYPAGGVDPQRQAVLDGNAAENAHDRCGNAHCHNGARRMAKTATAISPTMVTAPGQGSKLLHAAERREGFPHLSRTTAPLGQIDVYVNLRPSRRASKAGDRA